MRHVSVNNVKVPFFGLNRYMLELNLQGFGCVVNVGKRLTLHRLYRTISGLL